MTKPLELAPATCRVLTLADGKAPEWIQLLPLGFTEGRDGRRFQMDDAASVLAMSSEDLPLIVDEDHESEAWNGSTEASGWIEELRLVETPDAQFDRAGIWGRVDWTPEGATCVQGKGYRYISPTFYFWWDDNGVQHVAKLSSAALTNRPNLDLKALNRAGAKAPNAPATEVPKTMNAEQLAALKAVCGLGADASNDVLFVALNSKATAAAPNAGPDLRPELEKALNRTRELEKALADRDAADHEASVNAVLDGAVASNKLVPALRDSYRALCSTKAGLDQVKAIFAVAPAVIAETPKLAPLPATNALGKTGPRSELTEAEKAHCKRAGVSEENFLAAINEEAVR